MQVTQCDRCEKMPLDTILVDKEVAAESWGVQFIVVTSQRSAPDLCPDCFWELVWTALGNNRPKEEEPA